MVLSQILRSTSGITCDNHVVLDAINELKSELDSKVELTTLSSGLKPRDSVDIHDEVCLTA